MDIAGEQITDCWWFIALDTVQEAWCATKVEAVEGLSNRVEVVVHAADHIRCRSVAMEDGEGLAG